MGEHTIDASLMTVVRSVSNIRSDFPALQRHHHGRPVAFFDAPGGTQVPSSVIRAVTQYLSSHNANTHWQYPTSIETDRILSEARHLAALFLNAAPDEIAFGPNMTSLTYHLSRALGRSLGHGDTIVVTELDHHANIDPWRALATERGVDIRMVPVDLLSGTLDWGALESALKPGVKLLAIGGASNALGTVNDIRAATELAHAVGALVFVDAVHYAPHHLVDVQALDCDFLACSSYKFYGPHLGLLYGKRDVLRTLDVPRLEPAPDGPAERFETGTQNHEAIAGFAEAVRYLCALTPHVQGREALETSYAVLHQRGQELVERLWQGLENIDGVRLFGPPTSVARTPTVAFLVRNRPSDHVARLLADDGLFTSHGNFYALTMLRRLGVGPEGLVRVGCACYTSDEDVERLLASVARIAALK